MRTLALLVGCLLLAPAPSRAAACLPGPLTDYIELGSTGCDLAGHLVSDFSFDPLGGSLDPADVDVDPLTGPASVGLRFLFDLAIGSGLLEELLITYQITGGPFVGASVLLEGATADDDGAVTGVLDVCLDGAFGPGTIGGCTGAPETAIALVLSDPTLSNHDAQLLFGPASSIGVGSYLLVSGGEVGSASLDGSVVTSFQLVPEPATWVLLLGGGALGMWRSRGRSRQTVPRRQCARRQ